MPDVRALSIRQPWCWAIVHVGKRVENRRWAHDPSWRGPLLLHASQTTDRHDDLAAARLAGAPVPAVLPTGAYVAVTALLAVDRCDGGCSAWAFPGQLHLHLGPVTPLPAPMPGPGRLGLYRPPADLAAAAARAASTRSRP